LQNGHLSLISASDSNSICEILAVFLWLKLSPFVNSNINCDFLKAPQNAKKKFPWRRE